MSWLGFLTAKTNIVSPGQRGPGPEVLPAPPRAREVAPSLETRQRDGRRALTETLRLGSAPLKAPRADWRRTQVALRDLKDLPSLRSQAKRFAQTLSRDYCLLDEVVAEVARDPALTVNVLRLANSVSVGSRQRVTDLGTALQMLGVLRVRLMAQMLAAMDDARRLAPGFDWTHLWLHSAACAALAERLDRWSEMRIGGELQLAALLHDMGKIALSAVAPEAYRDTLVDAWLHWQALPPLEEARLGIDHREAGWIFAQEIDLPPVILSTIAHHDAPHLAPLEHRATVAAVAVANRLAKEHGLGFSGDGVCAPDELAVSEVWRTWEAALGRTLDAAELEHRLVEEWLPSVRDELAALRGEAAVTV